MNLKCKLGFHEWSKNCEECSRCGRSRPNAHAWKDRKCSCCGIRHVEFIEQKVCSIPDVVFDWADSEKGHHVAYRTNANGKQFVFKDGQIGPEFDGFTLEPLTFSPDGNRLAYAATRGGSEFVVVDGAIGPEFDMVRSIQFSLDSKHIIYKSIKGSQWFVVFDHISGPAFREINKQSPFFSCDGKHIAYVALTNEPQWRLIIDGEPLHNFNLTNEISNDIESVLLDVYFSPDGSRIAYGVKKREKYRGWHVIVDGKGGFSYDDLKGIVFSPDSRRIAYAASKKLIVAYGSTWHISVDGREGPCFEDVTAPVFSPDSSRVAYAAKTEPGRWCMIVDCHSIQEWKRDKVKCNVTSLAGQDFERIGKLQYEGGHYSCQVGPEFSGSGKITFSPDGKRLAYSAMKDEKWFVVVDGQTGPVFDGIIEGGPFFSLDSQHVAYVAISGKKQCLVFDGQAGPQYDAIKLVAMSFDGQCIAYAARTGQSFSVLINGKNGRIFDDVHSIDMTPDGLHIAYTAEKDEKQCVVLDGQAGPMFYAIYTPGFHSDKTFEFAGIRDGFFYRVTTHLQ